MTIPSTVIVESQREQHLADIRAAIRVLQSAVAALKSIADFTLPESADPSDWQQALAAAGQRKAEAYAHLDKNAALTSEQRESGRRAWWQWHRTVASHCNSIIKHLNAWPTAEWRWDSEACNIVPGRSTSSIADEMATKQVPAAAQQHGELIGKIYDAVCTLRRWEQHHGVRKLPVEALLKIDADSLGQQWATGSILRAEGLDSFSSSRVSIFESTFI